MSFGTGVKFCFWEWSAKSKLEYDTFSVSEGCHSCSIFRKISLLVAKRQDTLACDKLGFKSEMMK